MFLREKKQEKQAHFIVRTLVPNAPITNTNLFAIRRFLHPSGFPVLGSDGVVGLLGAVLVDALGGAIGDVG